MFQKTIKPMGRLNARVMETAGKAFYGGMESACNGNSV